MTGGPATTQPLGQGVTGLTLDLLAERIEHESEMRERGEEAVEKAREIQFQEYARRLETLNGEAGRIRDILAASVPRDTFETYKTEQQKALDAALGAADDKRDGLGREIAVKLEALQGEIHALNDTVKRAEGSLATWRFLAGGGGILGLVSLALWVVNARPPA